MATECEAVRTKLLELEKKLNETDKYLVLTATGDGPVQKPKLNPEWVALDNQVKTTRVQWVSCEDKITPPFSVGSVVSYRDTQKKRQTSIFLQGTNQALWRVFRSGNGWQWETQGVPPSKNAIDGGYHLTCLTFMDEKGAQRIYTFAIAKERLYVNAWIGGPSWIWKDLSYPGLAKVEGIIGAVLVYNKEGHRKIMIFVRGIELDDPPIANGGLFLISITPDVDTHEWQRQISWEQKSLANIKPQSGGNAVVTYVDPLNTRKIYAYGRGSLSGGVTTIDHILVNYGDGTNWLWAEQQQPRIEDKIEPVYTQPVAITYSENGVQKLHTFTVSQHQLVVNVWDGVVWKWRNQSHPPSGEFGYNVETILGATTYLDQINRRRIVIFCSGQGNQGIYVNYWDGGQWLWANQGAPSSGTKLWWDSRGVVSYRDDNNQHIIEAYFIGADKHLYQHRWPGDIVGAKWQWNDLGLIP